MTNKAVKTIITCFNTQGIARLDNIKSYIQQYKPQVFIATEVRSMDKPGAKIEPSGYTSHLTEGPNKILTLIRNDTSYSCEPLLPSIFSNSRSSCVKIRISHNQHNLSIIGVYLHELLDNSHIDTLFDSVKADENLIILGDFNAKHSTWNNSRNNSRGAKLNKSIQHYNWTVINTNKEPTFHRKCGNKLQLSTLDLAIVRIKQQCNATLTVQTDTQLTSDHHPIVVEWKDNNSKTEEKLEEPPYRISANTSIEEWELYRTRTETQFKKEEKTIEHKHQQPTQQLEQEWTSFKNTINLVALATFGTQSKNRAMNNWMKDPKIKDKEKQYTNAKKTYLKDPTSINQARMQLKQYVMKQTYDRIKQQYWEEFSNKLQSGHNVNWPTIKKSKRKEATSARNFLLGNNTTLPTTLKESLNNAVKDVAATFAKEGGPTPRLPIDKGTHVSVTEKEVDTAIAALWYTSPGPDKIHAKMIKELGEQGKKRISRLFDQSLSLGYLPQDWRDARTILIKKKGILNYNHAATFRPISITSVVARMLEKLVLARINKEGAVDKYLLTTQFGFRSKHSTTHALMRITRAIDNSRQYKTELPMVFLDIKKAFDSVDHDLLYNKIVKTGMNHNLVNWLEAFIKDRQFHITSNNISSTSQPIQRGVPQGAILSPLLFSIFINDLFTKGDGKIESQLYADDGVFWTKGTFLHSKLCVCKNSVKQ
jgi:Reverse transcriptase (RNA-dependent DNA polymerase)/Endonuclease-reverse transcriptase